MERFIYNLDLYNYQVICLQDLIKKVYTDKKLILKIITKLINLLAIL